MVLAVAETRKNMALQIAQKAIVRLSLGMRPLGGTGRCE